MYRRQTQFLVAGGILCLALSLLDRGLPLGYDVVGVSSMLFRAGVIYLSLGIFTYLRGIRSPRDAALGALGASTIVFAIGLIGMYYEEVLAPSQAGALVSMNTLVATQVSSLFISLPTSAGYLSGAFIRVGRHEAAILVLVGAMLSGWLGASAATLSLGSAPGFTQVVFLVAILAAAGFALLPIAVLTRWG